MTFLTRNSFLDEIRKQYVMTARAKGLNERQVLYGHVFRNAMLLIIAGFPGAFIHAFFSGALLIETIFSLDGLGLLELRERRSSATIRWCSPRSTSLRCSGLVVNLVSDFVYTLVDPRIDFESAGGLRLWTSAQARTSRCRRTARSACPRARQADRTRVRPSSSAALPTRRSAASRLPDSPRSTRAAGATSRPTGAATGACGSS